MYDKPSTQRPDTGGERRVEKTRLFCVCCERRGDQQAETDGTLSMEGRRWLQLRNNAKKYESKKQDSVSNAATAKTESFRQCSSDVRPIPKLTTTTTRESTKHFITPFCSKHVDRKRRAACGERTNPRSPPTPLHENGHQRHTAATFPVPYFPRARLYSPLHTPKKDPGKIYMDNEEQKTLFFSRGRRTAAPRSEPREPPGPGAAAPAWEAEARFGRSSGCGRR